MPFFTISVVTIALWSETIRIANVKPIASTAARTLRIFPSVLELVPIGSRLFVAHLFLQLCLRILFLEVCYQSINTLHFFCCYILIDHCKENHRPLFVNGDQIILLFMP